MLQLADKELLKQQAYIGGHWTGDRLLEVLNPANTEVMAKVPDLGRPETRHAIKEAKNALQLWRKWPARERALLMRRWYELMLEHQNDLAMLISAEQGKPLAEAKGEITYGASFVEWFAEEGKRAYGDIIPAAGADKRILVTREPVGVVGAITPWNFPVAMITRKVAPALAAGCTIVIKPAEDTPLSALALAELADRAGFPAGVINVVTTSRPAEVGDELCQNPDVRKLSFTGSTLVGKLLMKQCASTVKKMALELGGNAPFIIFDDADIDLAVSGVLASKFRNSGQTCICANRIFAQNSIYDQFVEKLASAVARLKVGPALTGDTQQGPLINQQALEKVEALVADASAHKGKIITGGHPHALGGNFYEPTVISEASVEMRCFREEIFGPVAPVFRFDSEGDVIAMANDTEYGLAAYFYANDLSRVFRVSQALEYGIVGVNEGVISTEVAPFGGVKESGLGREGSRYGLDEFLEMKYVLLGGIKG